MKKRDLYRTVLIWMIAFTLGACSNNQPGLEVEGVWARPGLMDGNSAVFFNSDRGIVAIDRNL